MLGALMQKGNFVLINTKYKYIFHIFPLGCDSSQVKTSSIVTLGVDIKWIKWTLIQNRCLVKTVAVCGSDLLFNIWLYTL